MKYFLIGAMLCLSLAAQESKIFTGHADLVEGNGIKGKALEIARYRAVRKAVEYAGVSVESESSIKDFVAEYDRVVVRAKGVVTNVVEVYADWDRGDKTRVLVLLQTKVDQTPERVLAARFENIVGKMVKVAGKKEKIKVAIDTFVFGDTELYGPFSAKVNNILEQVIEKNPKMALVRMRGIRVVGHHQISGNYRPQGDKLELKAKLQGPDGKVIDQYKFSIAKKDLQDKDLLPSNKEKVTKKIQAIIAPASAFKLQMTTTRGERALYRHGEKLVLEVQSSRDCYLQIYYFQNNDQIMRIFPNAYHKDNKIQGGKLYRIPAENYPFDFEIDCSKSQGLELIKAFASINSLPELKGDELGHGLRGIKVKARNIAIECRKKNKTAEVMCTVLTAK